MEKCQIGLVNSNCYHYKAELAECGEGDDFLNVILGEGTYCCK